MILHLTKDDTVILKGWALIMLLAHHLFYIQNGFYDDIYCHKIGIVWLISMACKACVALFVFLSGYGLTASIEKSEKINWILFFKKRFIHLFANYWLIWILFVPLGIFVFGISLDEVYGNKKIIKLILDFLGLLNCTGHYGYNPTWWFYSCIILLYLSFPFIISMLKNKWLGLLLILFSISLIFIHCGPFTPIKYYLFPFVLGCLFRNTLIINKLHRSISKFTNRIFQGTLTKLEILTIIIILIAYLYIRLRLNHAMLFDTLWAVLWIVLYKNINLSIQLTKIYKFLGNHSFNIFLFHTFIYYLFFAPIVYWNRNPIICLITLLSICIFISVSIEKFKGFINFNRIVKIIN